MKKILIFSSYGGGGHTAVAHALTKTLEDSYAVLVVNMFSQVLGSLDPLKRITNGRCTGEDIYNYLLPRKWYSLINLYYKIGAWYYRVQEKKVRRILKEYINSIQPDIVVSVIPIVNQHLLATCKELNIPFLLIPTDLDIATFIKGISKPTYQQFKIALPFNDSEAGIQLALAQIPVTYAKVTGFAIRPDFFEQKDILALKKQYAVPEGKPVILILLGAVGVNTLYTFTQQLKQLSLPVHLLICTGKQQALKEKIDALNMPPHITKTTIGFTQHIADLMAISDLFITKSGSVSVCEAIYMQLPMVLDATSKLLVWEKANHRFIQRHQFGTVLSAHEQIVPLITEILTNMQRYAIYKKNLTEFAKKQGCKEIKQLIEQMLNFQSDIRVQ